MGRSHFSTSTKQFYNGKSKGKNWAEALVDDESIIDIAVNALPILGKEEE